MNNDKKPEEIFEEHLSQIISYEQSNVLNRASTLATLSDNSKKSNIILQFPSNKPTRNSSDLILWKMLQLPPTNTFLLKFFEPVKVVKAMNVFLKMTIGKAMIQDKNGNTILMRLLNNEEQLMENKEFLVVLIESFKNARRALLIQNKDGLNALCIAALNLPKLPFIFGYLVAASLDKNIKVNKIVDKDDNTLLHIIAIKGDLYTAILKEMLKAFETSYFRLNISCRNAFGETPLHTAVNWHIKTFSFEKKHVHIIRILIENGADLMIKDNIRGETPLHLAFAKQVLDIEVLKALLMFSVPLLVNEKNNDGQTALHKAAKFPEKIIAKHIDICQLLLEAGASTDVQDKKGMTPLDLVLLNRKNIFQHLFSKYSNRTVG